VDPWQPVKDVPNDLFKKAPGKRDLPSIKAQRPPPGVMSQCGICSRILKQGSLMRQWSLNGCLLHLAGL